MSLSFLRCTAESFLRPGLLFSPYLWSSGRALRLQHTSTKTDEWRGMVQTTNLPDPFAYAPPEDRWRSASDLFMKNHFVPPKNAYSGRSVTVRDGNVAEAYTKLSRILNYNNVWKELRMTARHEKKGVKRRRLESERWRRRFKAEVRKKVQLVLQIRRRGA